MIKMSKTFGVKEFKRAIKTLPQDLIINEILPKLTLHTIIELLKDLYIYKYLTNKNLWEQFYKTKLRHGDLSEDDLIYLILRENNKKSKQDYDQSFYYYVDVDEDETADVNNDSIKFVLKNGRIIFSRNFESIILYDDFFFYVQDNIGDIDDERPVRNHKVDSLDELFQYSQTIYGTSDLKQIAMLIEDVPLRKK